jgi:putative DNA-binding protein
MAVEVPLGRLQRWLQEVVVHPGRVEEAVGAPAARSFVPRRRVGDVILPSATLRPEERLAIYHGMYLLRMEEALESDYPALKRFLGDDGFRALVARYVHAHPSRSYSLNFLGRHLPDFVRDAPGLRRPAFCHDLARLEQAVAEVFDEAEEKALRADEIAAVPEAAWERARLVPIAAFRLLAFRYPVNPYVQSVRDGDHAHPLPRRRDTWVAVYRREYAVWRQDLDRAGHGLLSDIAAGKRLGAAVAAALRRGGRRPPTQADLFRWFRGWMAAGMFRSVEMG